MLDLQPEETSMRNSDGLILSISKTKEHLSQI
jgi:hypothetical protein